MSIFPLLLSALFSLVLLFSKIALGSEPKLNSRSSTETVSILDLKATIYDAKEGSKKALYLYERHHRKAQSSDFYEVRFFDAKSKKPAALEWITYENGILKEYRLEHKQTGENSIVINKDGNLILKHKKKGESNWDSVSYPYSPSFIVPAQILDYLNLNWKQLKRNQKLTVKLAVPNFVNYFTFKYRLDEINKSQQTAKVAFVPSNIFINMFADKVELMLDTKNNRVLVAKGPTLLYHKDAQLIARTVFDYSHRADDQQLPSKTVTPQKD